MHTGEVKCILEEHRDDVNSVVLSPDGKTLASGSDDGTIQFWDMYTGELLAILEEDAKFPEGFSVIAFSPDGKTLASATAKQIQLWDTHTKQLSGVLEGHTSDVTDIVFSPR